jgi:hypothetical protein
MCEGVRVARHDHKPGFGDALLSVALTSVIYRSIPPRAGVQLTHRLNGLLESANWLSGQRLSRALAGLDREGKSTSS